MLFQGSLITTASGKVGGLVASHNAGGQYFRANAIPTNPGTPQQTTVRSAVANLTNRWENILTQLQRDGWQTYAANVTFKNRLGEDILLSGINQYVRSNVPRAQFGTLGRLDDAPLTFNLGEFTEPIGIFSEATQTISLGFEVLDEWVGEDGAGMLVYLSRPQNAGINYFKGPYRRAGSVDGNLALPPTSPAAIATQFAFVAGDRMFFQVRVTRADGRLSGIVRGTALAVA